MTNDELVEQVANFILNIGKGFITPFDSWNNESQKMGIAKARPLLAIFEKRLEEIARKIHGSQICNSCHPPDFYQANSLLHDAIILCALTDEPVAKPEPEPTRPCRLCGALLYESNPFTVCDDCWEKQLLDKPVQPAGWERPKKPESDEELSAIHLKWQRWIHILGSPWATIEFNNDFNRIMAIIKERDGK